jgi:quercetin dioxygenase-like cupin family protein
MDRIEMLEDEGFTVARWRDEPNARYATHLHRDQEVCVVLEGSMTFVTNGDKRTLRAGDRLDIAPDTTHEAFVGPEGCTYLTGRKR